VRGDPAGIVVSNGRVWVASGIERIASFEARLRPKVQYSKKLEGESSSVDAAGPYAWVASEKGWGLSKLDASKLDVLGTIGEGLAAPNIVVVGEKLGEPRIWASNTVPIPGAGISRGEGTLSRYTVDSDVPLGKPIPLGLGKFPNSEPRGMTTGSVTTSGNEAIWVRTSTPAPS
jgi:hypothetical protein